MKRLLSCKDKAQNVINIRQLLVTLPVLVMILMPSYEAKAQKEGPGGSVQWIVPIQGGKVPANPDFTIASFKNGVNANVYYGWEDNQNYQDPMPMYMKRGTTVNVWRRESFNNGFTTGSGLSKRTYTYTTKRMRAYKVNAKDGVTVKYINNNLETGAMPTKDQGGVNNAPIAQITVPADFDLGSVDNMNKENALCYVNFDFYVEWRQITTQSDYRGQYGFFMNIIRYKYQIVYDYNNGSGTKETRTSAWTDEGFTFATEDTNYAYLSEGIHSPLNNCVMSKKYPYTSSPDGTAAPVPTKAAYSFDGWSYTADGTAISSSEGIEVSATGHENIDRIISRTVYGLWSPKNFIATFDANGGTCSTPAKNYSINSTFTMPTPDARPGYEFAGWKLASIGNESYGWTIGNVYSSGDSSTPGSYGDVTFVAQWAPISYTLTFDPDGGIVSPTTKGYNITQSVTLPTPTKLGYAFAGWKVTTEGGNWSISDAAYVGTVAAGKWGNATLTAQYTKDGYTIDFEANGGSYTPERIVYTVDDDVTLPELADNTRPGYHFTGWKVKETSGTWTKDVVYDKDHLDVGTEQTGNVVLIAQWENGESDFIVSITGLQPTDDNVIFSIEVLSGKLSGKKFNLVLNSSKSSQTFKAFPVGDYKVTALNWSLSSDVKSVADMSKTYEQKNIAGGYEFKFIASQKSNPLPHAEASVNNVWAKKK